jgi:tetratricopeptide (TPR) repeat protein
MKQVLRKRAIGFLLICSSIFPAQFVFSQVTPEAGAMPAQGIDLVASTSSAEAKDLFNKALAASDMNEGRKARKLYSQAIEKDPELGIAYIFRAGTATSTKEFVDDVNMGRSKLANASEWEKMYADYLYTNLTGDRDKQMSIAKSMAEKFPSGRTYVELGQTYSGNKEYDKAETAFRKAMELNPGWVGGPSALTGLYLFGENKDLAKGQEAAEKVVMLAPNSPGAHVTLGDAFRAQNNLEKAAAEYKKAIALDPADATPYFKLGHTNVYLGKMAEARANFKEAGIRDQKKTFSDMLQAYTYGYDGDSKKMMRSLLDLADKYAKQPGVDKSDELQFLNAAATVAAHNGDVATLKTLITRITPISKQVMTIVGTPEAMIFHESDMLRWQAMLDILQGNYAGAQEKASQMKMAMDPLKDNRKLEVYHQTLGYMKLKQRQYREAIDHLKMADQLSLYNNYLQAKAYEGMGDKDNAAKHYKEIASNNFNSLDNAILRSEVRQKLK